MHNQSQHSKRVLPNTPRVSDKIMEYYQKFGHDRDLEKFMRLYSPASSQDSQKTQGEECGVNTRDSCCKRTESRNTISLTSSCDALAMMPSKPLNVCSVVNSKSLPNIDVHGQCVKRGEDGECFSDSDVILNINVGTECKKEKIISISTENLETPKKTFKNTTTQTPESVAKSHRRLEWDSLGDVGYKKSMSTSNISTIERSLLKEFFKESSVVSEPGSSVSSREQQLITKDHQTLKKVKATEIEHATPPLACSTLVETRNRGAKPKMITQSTSSTSLHKKFEKYAQTSLIKPPTVHSQEIQCSMSSSNSLIEGTATPSSFEYYSSRSSKSRSSSKSSELIKNHINRLEHPFIASITDLLMKRRALGEKNQQKQRHQFNSIRELQTKFQAALDENKENQSHSTIESSTTNTFSLSKQAPELDLGIQLICSLIDAKSVNGRQKKQLIRDIIKRITRFEAGEQTTSSTLGTITSSSGTTANSSDFHHHIYDSVRSSVNNIHKEKNMAKLKVPTELGVTPISTKQNNTEEPITASGTSGHLNNILAQQKTQVLEDISHCKQLPKTKIQCENALRENSTNVSNITTTAATKINKETQSELIITGGCKEMNKQIPSDHKQMLQVLPSKDSLTSIENKISRSTQTSKNTTSTSSISTTTPDLTTQKFIAPTCNDLNNSNTDAEQPTMREWLNPLTQSEIEYEEKKRKEMRKKADGQREKLLKQSKHDCGRVQQLNWIENEIKRLECLKHLLLKDETNDKSSNRTESSLDYKHITRDKTQSDKLYDTVYSDKSSVLSESAERLVKEIEIILEESHEDVINLHDNLKRTKDRKKEIQILYEKEDDSAKEKCKKMKAKFRTLKESVNINEEQLIHDTESDISNQPRRQREKIDTPSTEKSQESESLRDLVQQRKREFMEAYKTKKQHHYEALKQQQKEDYKYLNIQRKTNENRLTSTNSDHYSVPRTLPRKYVSSDLSYTYTHHPLPLKPAQRDIKQQNKALEINNTATTTSNTTTTSSSSMFCISSEVSEPISSQNISSSPTINHQYYEAAPAYATTTVPGVAVQTSDSLLRSKPIYERSLTDLIPFATTSACIQVKPKGIAYVIEFNDNKSSINMEIKSNDLLTKSNIKTSTEGTTNNKALLPSEPQLTLQEHLEKSKPKFLQQSKERKAILNKLQAMRQERDRQLREIIENTSFNSLDRHLQYLPPPPIQKIRILKTKEMKALTNKRFISLPEVVAKQEREIEEKKRRSNRILRDVFNRRLQKRVRSGKLSLNHSKTVI